jgi:hypothetical protein
MTFEPDDETRTDDAVSRWLDELGDAEPPASLRDAVMRAVRQTPGARGPASRPHIGGSVMARKVLWSLAAAAGIVLAIYTVIGYPALERGYEATIGAAKRNVSPQIAAPDVVLGDTSAQQFVQSETFAALVNDPATLKLLSDTGLRRMLADDALSAALRRTNVAELRKLADADLRSRLFDDANLRKALADENFVAAISDADFAAALQSEQFAAALRKKKLEAGLDSAEARKKLAAFASCAECNAALFNDALRGRLADADLRRNLADPAARAMLLNADLRRGLADAQLAAALQSDALRRALADNGFRAALRAPRFDDALSAAARGR